MLSTIIDSIVSLSSAIYSLYGGDVSGHFACALNGTNMRSCQPTSNQYKRRRNIVKVESPQIRNVLTAAKYSKIACKVASRKQYQRNLTRNNRIP
jgi:hypothetical protein